MNYPTLFDIETRAERKRCTFCGKPHICSSEAAERAAVEQCRQRYFNFLLNREFIRQEDTRGGAAA